MDLIEDLKNEIIISDINIFSLSDLELQQWLISNFVQQLYRKKVYIDEVTVTPINNSDYITKLSVVTVCLMVKIKQEIQQVQF